MEDEIKDQNEDKKQKQITILDLSDNQSVIPEEELTDTEIMTNPNRNSVTGNTTTEVIRASESGFSDQE